MTPQQKRASDPAASAWVSASAGTGKTHVLTNRVLRLLLAGALPERILCLTYTKAAAAEMANRIQERLAAWVVEPDERLRHAVHELTGEWPEVAGLHRARRLFARVLDAPGGLRIQTIHAFCQSLLGRFPVEVGLPPRFEALDDTAANELLMEATARVLSSDAPDLVAGVERLSSLAGDTAFEKLVQDFVAGRTRLPEDLSRASLGQHLDALAAALGATPGRIETRESVIAGFVAARRADMTPVEAAIAALKQGTTKSDPLAAGRLAAMRGPGDPLTTFEAYAQAFLTAQGEPRKNPMTKRLAERFSREAMWMLDEADELIACLGQAAQAEVHAASAALLTVGTAILDDYARAKARRRAVDYDDMVLKARDLLTKGAAATWVLYKLDGGLDHLLIDEAQDTSPAQWQLVRALTDEFFADDTAWERWRTVFAVGDVKQSIYSFQGAAPAVFGAERERVKSAVTAARKRFYPVELDLSFRSAPMVLELVDAVFALEAARGGVVVEGRLEHKAHRAQAAGTIELWPVEQGIAVEESEGWEPVETAIRGQSAEAALAERIADQICTWLERGEMLPARGRALKAGDIMILVRRRTGFVDALTRACKALGVPVAGSDRMTIAAQLGVMDLMAMGRFALLPDDDLTLAAVLKGPFIGLDEEALFDLAHGRPQGQSLWRTLDLRAAERADFAAAQASLAAVLARADFVTPFTFFARLLDEEQGRRRLIGRLGSEAIEPVEEFLSLALRHEADHPPSLQGFLHGVETGDVQLKRDLDRGRDEVRILTVHAAKGLEAPVVILPDTTALPGVREDLLRTAGGLPVWAIAGSKAAPAVASLRAAAQEAALEEYRRLLYVALTRAEDRLIVCGWRSGRSKDQDWVEGSWYDLVAAAFPADAVTVEVAPGFEIRRKSGTQQGTAGERHRSVAQTVTALPLPAWATRPAPVERRPSDPLSPSRAADADLGVASPIAGLGAARFLRGRLVHRLLELLPDLPAGRRPAAASRFLAARGEGLSPQALESLAAETLAVIDHKDFAPVFGPASRPEVPIAAVISEETVLGQIDRLVVLPDRVLIVDFKTDRPSPADWRAVATGYLRQLALYRTVVQRLYPDRPVEAALLWTETPRLMPIPGDRLDACLADLPGAVTEVDAPPPHS
ncbi:double-strand break repair helicase AddA [Oleomonas cavernae]|nr:double-strand break repair helicase AddA [Oleomonas cavernae]